MTPTTPPPADAILTIAEAGERLRLGRSRLYEELAAGRIEAVRLGRRTMIRASEVERYIRELPPAKIGRGIAA
jgi:excisionase family DNA binding protein